MAKASVDTDTLMSWKTKMESLNSNCSQNLENIKEKMAALNSSFQGEYSDKFEQNFGNYANKVINSHNQMGDIENFLATVVEVMEGH